MSSPASTPIPTFVPGFNGCTQVSPSCPVSASLYGYIPNLGANVFFSIVFGLLVIWQLALAGRFKIWSFGTWILIGLCLEAAGYIGRIFLHLNVWNQSAFRAQLVCLILAPSFLAAAMSVTFKHIIIYIGEKHSILKAKWYPYVFIGTDLMSIIIQAVGGGVAASGSNGTDNNEKLLNAGNALLVAGVAFQVANMAACGVVLLIAILKYHKAKRSQHLQEGDASQSQYEVDRHDQRQRRNLIIFTGALGVTYFTILTRCIYRIPEMAGGWGGPIMREQIPFIILDGVMIAIGSLAITIFHPGYFPRIFKHEVVPNREKHSSSSVGSDEETARAI